ADDRQVQDADIGVGAPVIGGRKAIGPQVFQNIVLCPPAQKARIDLENIGSPEKTGIFFADGFIHRPDELHVVLDHEQVVVAVFASEGAHSLNIRIEIAVSSAALRLL